MKCPHCLLCVGPINGRCPACHGDLLKPPQDQLVPLRVNGKLKLGDRCWSCFAFSNRHTTVTEWSVSSHVEERDPNWAIALLGLLFMLMSCLFVWPILFYFRPELREVKRFSKIRIKLPVCDLCAQKKPVVVECDPVQRSVVVGVCEEFAKSVSSLGDAKK